MIIYNVKGLLVGIAAVVVVFACIHFELSGGISFLITGAVAMYLSIKLSEKGTGYAGMPSLFLIPTHAYAFLILAAGGIAFAGDPSFFDKEADDKRVQLLERDLAVVDSVSLSGVDSVAHNIQGYVTLSLIRQLKPGNICYRVLESDDKKRVLVLVMFPLLDDLSKEARKDFAELVNEYVQSHSFFEGREVYLGIKDKSELKATRTPKQKHDGFLAVNSDLLPFYHHQPITK